MKRFAIVFAVATACGGTKTQPEPSANPTPVVPEVSAKKLPAPAKKVARVLPDKPDGSDVTELMRKMNGDTYGKPPVKFKKGHVRKKRHPRVKRTKLGFEVRFPRHAPITTPAVYQGAVYVSGGFKSKEYYAVKATTGRPLWSMKLDDDGPSTSACEEGICVFNTESCTVFAVNAETGKQKWSLWLGDPLTSAPTIANGRVFTSYPTGRTVGKKRRPPGASHVIGAFDLKTGKILWQKWIDSDVMSAPVAMNGYVYISTFKGTIIKFEEKTGKIRYAVRARATSAPVVTFASDVETMFYTRRGIKDRKSAEEMIVRADHNHPKTKFRAAKKKAVYLDKKAQSASEYAKQGKANDAANGFSGGAPAAANPKAALDNIGQSSVHTMQAFQGSRIVHAGKVNVNTMGDEVVATSPETGEKLWAHKLAGDAKKVGGSLGTAPLYAGDSVIVASLAGKVMRIDPASGKVRTTWDLKRRIRSQPVVHKGWIYVGTEDGRLIAIDTKDAKLTGWPTWGGNPARTGLGAAGR